MQTLVHLHVLSLLCTMVVWVRPRLALGGEAREAERSRQDRRTCGTPARLVAWQARRACAGLKPTSVRACVENSRLFSNSKSLIGLCFCSAHHGHMRHGACSLTCSITRSQLPSLLRAMALHARKHQVHAVVRVQEKETLPSAHVHQHTGTCGRHVSTHVRHVRCGTTVVQVRPGSRGRGARSGAE